MTDPVAVAIAEKLFDEALVDLRVGCKWKALPSEIRVVAEAITTTPAYRELREAAEVAVQSENHSPCRSGGMEGGEVVPNVCICEWAERLRKALEGKK